MDPRPPFLQCKVAPKLIQLESSPPIRARLNVGIQAALFFSSAASNLD